MVLANPTSSSTTSGLTTGILGNCCKLRSYKHKFRDKHLSLSPDPTCISWYSLKHILVCSCILPSVCDVSDIHVLVRSCILPAVYGVL